MAGAVNPATQSALPDGPTRTLIVGNDVVFNERITTTADGQAQLLFLDRSAFSIGPNSEIVIDEFVYDRNTGTGRLVATATKGVFRFVGGALSKQEGGVRLSTPSATIGVRGGVMTTLVDGGTGETTVAKHFGNEVSVTNRNGNTQRIYRNDFQLSVGPNGFGALQRLSDLVRNLSASAINPRPGGTGGARVIPRPTLVADTGFSNTNSAQVSQNRTTAETREILLASLLNGATPLRTSDVQTSIINQTVDPLVSSQLFPPLRDDDPLVQFYLARQGVSPLSALTDGVTPIGSLPLTGSFTYFGGVTGAVARSGVIATESGSFSVGFNFGQSVGSVSISLGSVTLDGVLSGRSNTLDTAIGNAALSGRARVVFQTEFSPADRVAVRYAVSNVGGTERHVGVGISFPPD